jgi:transmembrane sensor
LSYEERAGATIAPGKPGIERRRKIGMEELIIRALQGRATPEELAKIARWRVASPSNEHDYQLLSELWRDLPQPDVETIPPSPAAIRRLEAAPSAIPFKSRSRPRPWPGLRGVALAASIALLLLLSADLIRRRSGADSPTLQIARLATGPSETLMTKLSDGTTVFLAPNTALEVSSTRGIREVRLDGRAFFGVAKHGEDWPFVVQGSNGTVRVLGTRFEFSTRDDSTRVVVVEGRVNFAVDQDRLELSAGQMGIAGGDRQLELHPVQNVDEVLGWMGSTLIFENTRLDHAAREIERRYGAVVEIRSDELARRTISGGFKDRTFNEVVRVICRVVSAECTISETRAVIAERPVAVTQPTHPTRTN